MITSSSISYISQLLDNPQNISEADSESISQLVQAYPYFVPGRYLQSALSHKGQPFNPDMMSTISLYRGNWWQYSDYLYNAAGTTDFDIDAPVAESAPKVQQTVEEPIPAIPDISDLPEEELAEEQLNTPVAEQHEVFDNVIEEELPVTEEVKEELIEETENTDTGEFIPKNTEFVRSRADINDVSEETELPPSEIFEDNLPDEVVDMSESAEEHLTTEQELPKARPDAEQDQNLIPPIYTEDYFLHQGMPVSNQIPDDLNQSGQPMDIPEDERSLMVVMSFSEWLMYYKKKRQQEQEEEEDQRALKTMWQKERLAAALEEGDDEIPENVFEMAVNSISKEDALASEALAAVYLKQGRHDKAIEMYKKLSLRKPQKKAYFARKIEEVLKEK